MAEKKRGKYTEAETQAQRQAVLAAVSNGKSFTVAAKEAGVPVGRARWLYREAVRLQHSTEQPSVSTYPLPEAQMVKISDLVEDFRRADIGGRRAKVRFTDEDRVEVDIMLDGAEGREGHATVVEVYARYDVETGELLSIDMVPYYRPPSAEA